MDTIDEPTDRVAAPVQPLDYQLRERGRATLMQGVALAGALYGATVTLWVICDNIYEMLYGRWSNYFGPSNGVAGVMTFGLETASGIGALALTISGCSIWRGSLRLRWWFARAAFVIAMLMLLGVAQYAIGDAYLATLSRRRILYGAELAARSLRASLPAALPLMLFWIARRPEARDVFGE